MGIISRCKTSHTKAWTRKTATLVMLKKIRMSEGRNAFTRFTMERKMKMKTRTQSNWYLQVGVAWMVYQKLLKHQLFLKRIIGFRSQLTLIYTVLIVPFIEPLWAFYVFQIAKWVINWITDIWYLRKIAAFVKQNENFQQSQVIFIVLVNYKLHHW